MSALQELQDSFDGYRQTVNESHDDHERSIAATMCNAIATKMLVELLATGAYVRVDTR